MFCFFETALKAISYLALPFHYYYLASVLTAIVNYHNLLFYISFLFLQFIFNRVRTTTHLYALKRQVETTLAHKCAFEFRRTYAHLNALTRLVGTTLSHKCVFEFRRTYVHLNALIRLVGTKLNQCKQAETRL